MGFWGAVLETRQPERNRENASRDFGSIERQKTRIKRGGVTQPASSERADRDKHQAKTRKKPQRIRGEQKSYQELPDWSDLFGKAR